MMMEEFKKLVHRYCLVLDITPGRLSILVFGNKNIISLILGGKRKMNNHLQELRDANSKIMDYMVKIKFVKGHINKSKLTMIDLSCELNITTPTLRKILNGEIIKLDTYVNMYDELKKGKAMSRDDMINRILEYQEAKEELVAGLIPDDIRLAYDTIDENLDFIIGHFKPAKNISFLNCIHCNIYRYYKTATCSGCPYAAKTEAETNACMLNPTVLKAAKQFDVIMYGNELSKIGEKLEEAIKSFKENR